MKNCHKKYNKIHFIGIGGSAISSLAVMLKKEGYKISGSDEKIYDPALSLLEKNKVDWYEGTKPERVKDADLVIIGGSMLIKNPENEEYLEAKQLGKRIESFTYLVGKHIVKEESIVVAGTYGKTTITSIIAWILEVAKKEPSFLIGGQPLNFEQGIKKTESEFSVVEGDEFAASFGFDMTPKFMYYKPKHTIITAAQWDHLNMYSTEKAYVDAYKSLVKLTKEKNGSLYISTQGQNNENLVDQNQKNTFLYGTGGDFRVNNIQHQKKKTSFEIKKGQKNLGKFETTLLGKHNIENCLAAISLLYNLGIKVEDIREGIKTFKGVKRRLEIIGKNSKGATIIDDFAHSPVKAKSTLEALRTRYKNEKIITFYSPRTSEMNSKKVLDWYKDVFSESDVVIIPKITVKKNTKKEDRVHGIDILDAIEHKEKYYFPRQEQIIKFLKENSGPNTLIVFMSAGDWGELVNKTIHI